VDALKAKVGDDFVKLCALINDVDSLYVSFIEEVTAEFLQKPIKFKNFKGEDQERIVWQTVFHVLNHFTHHCGVISGTLDRMGMSNDFAESSGIYNSGHHRSILHDGLWQIPFHEGIDLRRPEGMTFNDVMEMGHWVAIKDCPGRYTLHEVSSSLSVGELLGADAGIQMAHSPKARDTVYITCLEDGGVISYSRLDGSWLHTLNTEVGFERKLRQLEIDLQGPR